MKDVPTSFARVSFVDSDVVGEWRIGRVHALRGEPLARARGPQARRGHRALQGGRLGGRTSGSVRGALALSTF